MSRRAAAGSSEAGTRSFASARLLALLLAFVAAALFSYGPALDGQFFSDDQHYVRDNAYVHELNATNLAAIWNPIGGVAVLVENYAPVHITLYALEWPFFGGEVRGYHVVNVIAHALAAWMLVLVYRRSGLSEPVAALLAAIFLLHPANVEAVAWVAQLKTPVSMVLAIAALLLHPRRAWLALVLFLLALLAKPTAIFALPVVALFGWTRRDENWRWPLLAGWLGVFALFSLAEFAAFYQTAARARVCVAKSSATAAPTTSTARAAFGPFWIRSRPPRASSAFARSRAMKANAPSSPGRIP